MLAMINDIKKYILEKQLVQHNNKIFGTHRHSNRLVDDKNSDEYFSTPTIGSDKARSVQKDIWYSPKFQKCGQ